MNNNVIVANRISRPDFICTFTVIHGSIVCIESNENDARISTRPFIIFSLAEIEKMCQKFPPLCLYLDGKQFLNIRVCAFENVQAKVTV